ncbi:DUF3040 domain-containing protein [Stackebrandtia nassauensis]|uniref:Transmembrane protein n=1 Tax=Stackebrandtia nassauensis (strain DSM 44728 / CIP 108903 / NRRL B-16338 / NBRC 102104 / LLR-40K-21) TaxID=446470 RepID=D3Q9L6_STANL|nr:DUF3040 domain-containing protein [Stackebrandtia nassauensis]ADD44562.1 hypothetical protein Snas_4921 [Stackebrandtia nassauensis DSM 44728]
MPLSEHEQRVFDEIERSLADDPKFASAVRAHDPRHRGRRRMIIGGLISVVGLIVMVLGVMNNSLWIGAVGAVVAFVGILVALHIQRKGSGELSAVGGKARRRTGKPTKRHPGGGSSWGDRLEERWRRRRDNGWQ